MKTLLSLDDDSLCVCVLGVMPDVQRIIDSIIQRDQETVRVLLDSYNTQVSDGCYDYCTTL